MPLTQKRLTNPGVVMGTIGYMSPEQVRGQEADHRADIFSFGVILYEMLSGRRTFAGESAIEVMNAILKEEPPELGETNAKVSPALDKIVRHCLEKKPDRRFQSASDLGFALESLSTPTSSSGSSLNVVSTEVTTTASPHVWKMLAVAAVIAAVVIGLGAFIVGKHVGTSPPPTYQRLSFNRGTIRSARFAPDDQTVVYSAR